MYLKSIEVHGFKSFANKILFEFHNGITGIVGPNGSGKSNVADAVRWVLGEQRAKQLRGANMQDIIFSGTENRKPLSYAYVAITLDNADRQLSFDYNEVTVARRVYRSGESEYLLNGTPCRLKDVNELFYDTGIGKEGYSIIGQGQIEKILNGKPEERRELFDEAAGIVKYKRRKDTAQKKLQSEQQNLVRVNDILTELEKQVEPLERQSEKARIYLKKKEQLKLCDVNLFLLEAKRIKEQLSQMEGNTKVVEQDFKDSQTAFEGIKEKYEKTEQSMEQMENAINLVREEMSKASLGKGKLEGEINVLTEQINGARQSEELYKNRQESLHQEITERSKQMQLYQDQEQDTVRLLEEVKKKRDETTKRFKLVQEKIALCQEQMEQGKNEVIELLNNKASTKAKQQRYDTMLEQLNIRKAQINKLLLERKSDEGDMRTVLTEAQNNLAEIDKQLMALAAAEQSLEQQRSQWQEKLGAANLRMDAETKDYNREQSRLESMMNIAERYDGYGNSIRRVMEQKDKEPGLLGVVADLIKVDQKYEIAIETALGGSIQNIVTADEATAKEMIAYLKKNRYGRATFLPLTSVGNKLSQPNQQALQENGVIGMASDLVKTGEKYQGLCNYLLGRTYVVDNIDNGVALAGKYHYSLRIVTLEGESLNPGGSMTGGAFKNSSNLLGRKREIEELERKVARLKVSIKEQQQRLLELQTARELLKDEQAKVREGLQEMRLKKNTAGMNVEHAKEQMEENDKNFQKLKGEIAEMEGQMSEITISKTQIKDELAEADKREKEIEAENTNLQGQLEMQNSHLEQAQQEVSAVQLEEANIGQQAGFMQENRARIQEELRKLDGELEQAAQEAAQSAQEIEKKQQEIKNLQKTIADLGYDHDSLADKLSRHQGEREALSASYKGFFQQREELSARMNDLDKELFRLNSQREKLSESLDGLNNYMWEEYELTYHNALALRYEAGGSLQEQKQQIAAIKEEIKRLGDVNVNAIDDYKNLFERYSFMKTQHDDLIEAEKTLLEIITDLDAGMRRQFMEKFVEIQREFDKAFKELFGGGKGSLALVEDEDILTCGIRIVAQPPGKKLQNMMQLSGGEKALTAISLLFAIQNLKPSPFCLLDEIEAALDDSNVGRFAKYLHRLTKHTQFIVITHRRGTMAAADRLYGITMQEKGVSTLVSVNLIEEDLEQ